MDSTGDCLISFDASSGSNDWHYEAGNASQYDGTMTAINLGTIATGANGPYSGWHLFEIYLEAGVAIKVFVDGVEDISGSYTLDASSNGTIRLFGGKFAGTYMAGSFAELWVTSDLSAQSNYRTYLTNKWAV